MNAMEVTGSKVTSNIIDLRIGRLEKDFLDLGELPRRHAPCPSR